MDSKAGPVYGFHIKYGCLAAYKNYGSSQTVRISC